MPYLEQANGIVRSYAHVSLLFPFGLSPTLIFGNGTVPIVNPSRFGAWGTSREQCAYVRAFALGEEKQ